MCGYCIEESVLMIDLSEEIRCESLPDTLQSAEGVVDVFAQESNNVDVLLETSSRFQGGDEDLVYTGYCRLLGLLASGRDCEAQRRLAQALRPHLLGRGCGRSWQYYFHQAGESAMELFGSNPWQWIYDLEQVLSGTVCPAQTGVSFDECARFVEFYCKWWLEKDHGGGRRMRRHSLLDKFLPIFYCSVQQIAQNPASISLLGNIYALAPKCMPNFRARDLWIKRTALRLLAENQGVKYIVERFAPLYPPHALYLFLVNDEMRSNKSLAVSQIRDHVDTFGAIHGIYHSEYIRFIELWPSMSLMNVIAEY